MTAGERVDYRAQITALVPPHAHHPATVLSNLFAGLTWVWTTPDGTWRITWGGLDGSSLSTPFGRLKFDGAAEVAYRRMVGVLLALGGIEAQDGTS